MNKQLYKLGMISMVLVFQACSEDKTATSENEITKTVNKPTVQINPAVYEEMINSLPQPIEIAGIITKSKTEFSKEMLVPSEISTRYPDKYYQAMAFGSFGVDLGYINLNDKKLFVIEYLEAMKNLAEELKVSQFFDFQTLYELNSNRNNPDSMILISTRNFNRIDEFLREENRGEFSVLILIGAWTEGMHMFGRLYNKEEKEDILNRIGEQKVVFQNIALILDKLSNIDHFNKLKADVAVINRLFADIKVDYIYHEPETKEVNGELLIVDKTETKISITKDNAKEIIAAIENFRNKYSLLK
ncbi:MAG: hypothetical protein ACXVPN_11145 [Bacteroidia bacterium]